MTRARRAGERKRRKVLPYIILGLAAVAIFCVFAFDERPVLTEYTVKSSKVAEPVRILHITDLHNCLFGEEQSRLTGMIDAAEPDIVVFTGDMSDPRYGEDNALLLARLVSEKYPSFYVFGNHENAYPGNVSKVCDKFAEAGLTVLRGSAEKISVGGTALLICGIDDPNASPDYNLRMWENELDDCAGAAASEPGVFSVLLTHRPECVNDYAGRGFDLIMAGHAHGGQARIPLILQNGIYAPSQGLFPKYTGGLYRLSDGTPLEVCRGLSTKIRPRVFNRPEISLVTVEPGENPPA